MCKNMSLQLMVSILTLMIFLQCAQQLIFMHANSKQCSSCLGHRKPSFHPVLSLMLCEVAILCIQLQSWVPVDYSAQKKLLKYYFSFALRKNLVYKLGYSCKQSYLLLQISLYFMCRHFHHQAQLQLEVVADHLGGLVLGMWEMLYFVNKTLSNVLFAIKQEISFRIYLGF